MKNNTWYLKLDEEKPWIHELIMIKMRHQAITNSALPIYLPKGIVSVTLSGLYLLIVLTIFTTKFYNNFKLFVPFIA